MDKQNLISLIGNTPLIKPDTLLKYLGFTAEIYCKCEGFNPAGSVKDRIGLSLIEIGEQAGAIKQDTVIIEATSGNTGIGLAFICAQRGYRLILTMPESMSVERRALLRAMGAELVLTEASLGMQGAVHKAETLAAALPSAYIAGQFENPANPAAHYQHTAPEIWQALDGKIDVLIATIGSGGTITGCGRFFKEKNQEIRVIGVEPAESPLLSAGQAGPHLIQGIGANFVPPVLDRSVIDEMMTVKGVDAIATAQLFGQKEGYLLGISSGAALAAALAYAARKEAKNKTIVAILPDRGERYISTPLFDFGGQA
jgi:cysteine synthase